MELTKADERRLWNEVIKNQQIILNDKRIRHRNFETYSKHSCPYEDCIYQGLMVRPNSQLAWGGMHFDSGKSRYQQKAKSERKREQLIINKQISDQYKSPQIFT